MITDIANLQDMYAPEKLNAELKRYIVPHSSLGEILQHPLVYAVPYSEVMNKQLNLQLKYRREATDKALQEENWIRYLFLHERPYRFSAFTRISRQLSDEEYWTALSEVWTDSENIYQNYDGWHKLWNSTRKCREKVMCEEDQQFFDSLPEALTVYRGTNCEIASLRPGLSWSLDIEVAQMFAKRFAAKRRFIYRAKISKSQALAYFSNRSEAEIVTEPVSFELLK